MNNRLPNIELSLHSYNKPNLVMMYYCLKELLDCYYIVKIFAYS